MKVTALELFKTYYETKTPDTYRGEINFEWSCLTGYEQNGWEATANLVNERIEEIAYDIKSNSYPYEDS